MESFQKTVSNAGASAYMEHFVTDAACFRWRLSKIVALPVCVRIAWRQWDVPSYPETEVRVCGMTDGAMPSYRNMSCY